MAKLIARFILLIGVPVGLILWLVVLSASATPIPYYTWDQSILICMDQATTSYHNGATMVESHNVYAFNTCLSERGLYITDEVSRR